MTDKNKNSIVLLNSVYICQKNYFMSLIQFISSKVFFKHLAVMAAILLLISFALMQWLDFTTNHGDELTVPVSEKLEGVELEYVLIDSIDYRSDFPPLSVVNQDPEPGEKVKKNRKIYIKINSSSYGNITLPNLIQISYRQAAPTIKALGLQEGSVSYVHNIGKDMVLEINQNGRILKEGDKVKKASKINIVLGDGISAESIDSTKFIQQIIDATNSF